jgi:hypothetical protein
MLPVLPPTVTGIAGNGGGNGHGHPHGHGGTAIAPTHHE